MRAAPARASLRAAASPAHARPPRPQLPATLLSQPLLAVSPEAAHAHAFVETNRNLRASKVDDSLSGTTAITMLLQGASLTVANVGDSRACLAEESGRKLTAFNLSCDQTPFRCVCVCAPRRAHISPARLPTRSPAPPSPPARTNARACAARVRGC